MTLRRVVALILWLAIALMTGLLYTAIGWVAALVGAVVGFIAGFTVIGPLWDEGDER